MAQFSLRLLGLLLLTLGITVSSCQALFPRPSDANAPRQLSPSSFGTDER